MRALIAVGGNLGDREASIRTALRHLASPGSGVRVVATSALRETEPQGGPPQGRYLNGAAVLETSLAPDALLDALHAAEAAAGRIRKPAASSEPSIRWGPRTADLDLLLYGDRIVSARGLEVPHPRMHERRFVLEPAAEIAPDWIHPRLGRTVLEMLEALPA